MKIFIDTSAFLGLIDSNDLFFEKASVIFKDIANTENSLYCSNYIILETIVILQKRIGLDSVEVFNNDILPVTNAIFIDKQIHDLCLNHLFILKKKDISFVDLTSFELMRKLGIKKAFTFDKHFRQFGFEVI